MFAAMFRKAQASVDRLIGQAVNRVLVAVPFVVAGGFAVAALTIYLTRELGPVLGCLAIAVIFALVGLVVAAVVGSRQPANDAAEPEPTEAEAAAGVTAGLDRELIMSGLTAAAPALLPHVLRLALRNIPLLATIAVAIYIMTRPGGLGGTEQQPNQT